MNLLIRFKYESMAARAAGLFHIFMAAALEQVIQNEQAKQAATRYALPSGQLFSGRIAQPLAFRNLLTGLHNVVDARFFQPNLARLMDPVVTSGSERLRLECFSSCASVYARVDLNKHAFSDCDFNNEGTTNVDFGRTFLQNLSTLRPNEPAHFEMGQGSVKLISTNAETIEQKVKLPERWLKGFLQIQAVLRRSLPVFELNRVAARYLLQTIPANVKDDIYIIPRAHQPQVVRRAPATGEKYLAIAGAHRLRLLQIIATDIQSLRVYQIDETGSTVWVADTGLARMTLALSGRVEYGFSGDGEALRSLNKAPDDAALWLARTTAAQLNSFTIEQFIVAENIARPNAIELLDYLSTQGILGYDRDDDQYFYRVLPFALNEKALPNRIKGMQELLTGAKVKIIQSNIDGNAIKANGVVEGIHGTYQVEVDIDEQGFLRAGDCTCNWIAKYGLKRGPCKHMLALRFSCGNEDK